MTFDQLRIEIRVLLWEYRIKILIGAVLLTGALYVFGVLQKHEAARVAAFTPEYKAAIVEGEKILDSAKVGDFLTTSGGVLLEVREIGANPPGLEGVFIKSFPSVVNCANGRRGPVVRGDMTLSRIVGLIPAVGGRPDPAASARCRDQGSIALHELFGSR